jgi:type IV pilus assembly protein PilX
MNPHPLISASEHSTQRGAALLTALVFLVVLTLLGIGVYSTTTSEEKMARNFRDKEIALQSAEAALNEAKMLINGSYNSGGTQRKPLSEESCYRSTPTGFTCDPTTPVATLDLFSGSITGAPVGQIGTDISPTIVGLYNSNQPRYLVVWQPPSVCGISNTSYCFQIVAQGRGRLANTRVNLVELFTY